MSNQLATLNGGQVPAVFHSLMQQMQTSELSQNVGANYAVLSIKGKVFRIKFGGTEVPITIQFNGQEYAAPFYDVVIPLANAALSKTWYTSGYTEGSDESPTCWSEDGRTPLAPLENRPKLANGQPCHDCALCPMNVFGSKINEQTGAKGKACADTRKLVIIPTKVVGQHPDGSPITEVDAENTKYGGPMLMRVPAASLQAFAEYDRKLQAMGVPYFAVVTRLQFDQTVAYPKFQLAPVRLVTDGEAQQIIDLRNNPLLQHILGGAHDSSPAPAALPAAQTPIEQVTSPVAQAVAQATGAVPNMTDTPQQPMPMAAPVAPAPVATAVPVAPAQPATAAPVAPAAPAFPPQAPAQPAPVQAAPAAPAQVAPMQIPMQAAPMAPAPVQTAPMAPPTQAFPGFAQPVQAAPAQTAPAQQQAAAPAATVSPELLGRIDQLLDS